MSDGVSKAHAVVTRCALVLLVAVATSIGLVGSASAHDVLISSDPKDGATVTTAPSSVTFTFDQPVQNFDPVVSLVGPDGKQYATGTPSINGNVVTGTVAPGAAGAYTAAYRIVSADGHPVTGEIHFTLAGDGGAATPSGAGPPGPTATGSVSGSPTSGPAAAAPTTTAASSAPPSDSGGLGLWLWIGLIGAALVIAAAAVILLRRPTGRRSGGTSGNSSGGSGSKDY